MISRHGCALSTWHCAPTFAMNWIALTHLSSHSADVLLFSLREKYKKVAPTQSESKYTRARRGPTEPEMRNRKSNLAPDLRSLITGSARRRRQDCRSRCPFGFQRRRRTTVFRRRWRRCNFAWEARSLDGDTIAPLAWRPVEKWRSLASARVLTAAGSTLTSARLRVSSPLCAYSLPD